MNVQNLRDNYPKLISYMETNGYSKTYVDRFKGEIEKILATGIQRNCYAIQIYICSTPKHHTPLIISAINELSSEPLNSLMFMVATRMEDEDMSFLKEVLIRCCRQNSNLSLTITVKQKRNVARKLPPFIQNLIMHPHFSYHSSKKE